MTTFPFDTVPLTVKRPGRKIRNGALVEDWSNPVEHTTGPGAIEGGDSTEDHYLAETTEIAFTWNGPVDADVKAGDRVSFVYAGRTFEDYEVVGLPRLMADDLGLGLDYQLVKLSKREG